MTETTRNADAPSGEDDVSLFAIASIILENRRRIFVWMLVGVVIAVVPVLFTKPTYTATASFVPQTLPDPGRSGLANLAGQFGIQVGGAGSAGQSPDFYVSLLQSRVILAPIVSDTFSIPESPGTEAKLLDLFNIKGPSEARRIEMGVAALREGLDTKIASKTGIVSVAVTTPWPSLSQAIVARAVAAVNAFNLRERQSQASEERRFTEGRLSDARIALRSVEDRLQLFLQRNRQIQNSPELSFERDRIQREVSLQQQIVSSLAQAYEEVRIREVRDIPVITVIEQPLLPTQANGRGRLKRGIAGLIAGAFMGIFIAFAGEMVRRRQETSDPDAELFRQSLNRAKADVGRILPGRRRRAGL